jgi:hypothetical protein
MKIRYENTIDDIIAFRRHANNAPHVHKGLRLVLIIPAAFFLILGILAAVEEQDPTYVAGGVVIGLAWAGLLWLFIRWRLRASLRRLRRDDSVCNLPCWYELELADGTLVERTDRGSHASALETVTEIASSDSHTFICLSSGAAYVIPRRSAPEGEYQEFIDAVRREWEQTATLAWRPAPANVSSPKESNSPLPPVADTSPLGRGLSGHYPSKRWPKLARCRACGKPMPRGKFTCQQCGRTWWAPIYVLLVIAVAVKAGAVCAGLWLRNPWANNLAAWGGSLLAGYFFLGGIGSVIGAFRRRKTISRPSPEAPADPALKAHAISLGQSMLALALTIGFVLVGNTIGLELGVCLGTSLVFLAVGIVLGMVRSAALSATKRKLAARLAAKPEMWPAIPPLPDGIIAANTATGTARTSPADLAAVEVSPGVEVKLRVLCPCAWVVASLTVSITLDGQLIGIGSLRRGFDARGETTPGVREIQIRWGRITERFVVYLPRAGAYEAELRYSSFWAKFLPRGAPE